jgi:hypothetical protein
LAVIIAKFEKTLVGSANTSTKDDWYDIGNLSSPSQDSPIPSGINLLLGFLQVGSQDKSLVYELRTNKPTKSAGTVADTSILTYTASDPTSGSVLSDLNFDGKIKREAPEGAASTGVEKLWLRVMSGSNTVANFQWFLYYTAY